MLRVGECLRSRSSTGLVQASRRGSPAPATVSGSMATSRARSHRRPSHASATAPLYTRRELLPPRSLRAHRRLLILALHGESIVGRRQHTLALGSPYGLGGGLDGCLELMAPLLPPVGAAVHREDVTDRRHAEHAAHGALVLGRGTAKTPLLHPLRPLANAVLLELRRKHTRRGARPPRQSQPLRPPAAAKQDQRDGLDVARVVRAGAQRPY